MTTIIHIVGTGDMQSWSVEEDVSPSSGLPFWSLTITRGGCLEYVGGSITTDDLYIGKNYCKSDLDEYRNRAIKEAESRLPSELRRTLERNEEVGVVYVGGGNEQM